MTAQNCVIRPLIYNKNTVQYNGSYVNNVKYVERVIKQVLGLSFSC